jgi:hypothetical protein
MIAPATVATGNAATSAECVSELRVAGRDDVCSHECESRRDLIGGGEQRAH